MARAPSRPGSAADSGNEQSDLRAKADDAMSAVGDVARQAVAETRRSAVSLASEANDKVKEFMGEKVGAGATWVSHVSAAARAAADSLDPNAPQLAALVRSGGERLQEFSRDMEGQSIDDLVRRTSNFARERPAAVFGVAAAAGFLLFRLFKAAPASQSHRGHDYDGGRPQGSAIPRDYEESPSISPRYGKSHGS
jgi:ElaB/YqjD/DUF883 family membrane-anchored ribosome-binding protein